MFRRAGEMARVREAWAAEALAEVPRGYQGEAALLGRARPAEKGHSVRRPRRTCPALRLAPTSSVLHITKYNAGARSMCWHQVP